MKIYFRDEEQPYDIDKGWTYTKNANENLDSAVVRISHIGKLDIQPFDDVRIVNDDGQPVLNYATNIATGSEPIYTLYLCIDSYQEQQISLDPVIYNYEINLFSETKKLENAVLPNLSITPHKLSNPLTIKEFISRVWNLYCPKKRLNGVWVNKYSLNTSELPDRFNKVCPELQWSTPTLREVLNKLYLLCDCIPTMVNNTMGYLDLTSKKNPITNFNFITRSRSSQDYTSELKMNLQNILQEKTNDYTNTITTYEKITFTTDGALLTDQNLFLRTQYPILNIKHLWVTWCSGLPQAGTSSTKQGIFIRSDLCDLRFPDDIQSYSIVKEKSFYDILNIIKYSGVDQYDRIEPYTKYQNYCLHYTRGSNKIEGFNNVGKVSVFFTSTSLGHILTFAEIDGLRRLGEDPIIGSVTSGANFAAGQDATSISNVWFFPSFEIEYETSKESVFSASKKENPRNKRIVMDNQENAWVNIEAQGNLEYQKANRVGNENAMINQRCTLTQNPIDIFDFLGNEIAHCVEYQFYDNYVGVNATAIKDYILRDYFTGINSKVRTWINAKEEAFIRHDLYKYYIELDIVGYEEISNGLGSKTNDYAVKYLSSSIVGAALDPIKYCYIRCDDYPYTGKAFATELSKRIIGNSIVYTWGFDDNYIALIAPDFREHEYADDTPSKDGKIWSNDFLPAEFVGIVVPGQATSMGWIKPPRIDPDRISGLGNDPDIQSAGGIPIKHYPYCNDDGNFTNFKIGFFNGPLTSDPIYNGKPLTLASYFNKISNIVHTVDFDTNQYLCMKLDKNIYKDNKEIITGSLQFEYWSNNKKIVMYDSFYKLSRLVVDETLGVLELYSYDSPELPSSPIPIGSPYYSINITYTGQSMRFEIADLPAAMKKRYIFICRSATSHRPMTPILRLEDITTFYVNVLAERDKEGL